MKRVTLNIVNAVYKSAVVQDRASQDIDTSQCVFIISP